MYPSTTMPSRPEEWTKIRPQHGSVTTLNTGVHAVAERDDVAIAVYTEAGDITIIGRYCPHYKVNPKDLTQWGAINCTTNQMSCYHLRRRWDLPTGVATMGENVKIYEHKLVDGTLWALLPTEVAP